MKSIFTKGNCMLAASVVLLAISVWMEHRFCVSSWISETVTMYMFIAFTVAVQSLIIQYIARATLKEYAKRHWLLTSFVSCVLSSSVFFLMLHKNYIAHADANSDAAVQAFIFNLTPFVVAAVCFAAWAVVYLVCGRLCEKERQ